MPRAVAITLGAITAALVAPSIGAAATLSLVAAICSGALLARLVHRPVAMRLVLGCLLGFGLVAMRGLGVDAIGPETTPPEGRGPWSFAVEAVGAPRAGQQVATLVARGTDGTTLRVAATLPPYPVVIPGDIVTIEGAIRPPPLSPYGEYLVRIGAVGTLRADTLTVEPGASGPGRSLEAVRRAGASALATALPQPEAGLAAGILIGLRDLVDRDLAAAFTTAGVSHVVAISGWNIAIVAAAVAALVGRIGRRRRSVVTLVAIVAYVVVAGASASVVRAGLMAAVVLLARESGRAGQAMTALAWTITVLLLVDPALVADAGLQLSALATAGLIVWASPLQNWLERISRGHLPGWLAENLGVSLAAQAATLPLILVSFGRLSLVAPVVNLFVVPLIAPAMAAGLIAMGSGLMVMAGGPAVAGAVLAAPGWVLLRGIVAIVDAAAGVPFASVTLESPVDTIAAAMSGLAIVAVHRWAGRSSRIGASAPGPSPGLAPVALHRPSRPLLVGDRWTRGASIALILTVATTGAVMATRPAGRSSVTVLDVGQGDAILVEGARGSRLLVDGGPDPGRLLVDLDARLPPWDRRIDAVILSHPHEDHVAGLAALLDRYAVRTVFEPGTRGPGPGYGAWVERLGRPAAPDRRTLVAGDRIAVDDISMAVLWPKPGRAPLEPPDGGTGINNVSIVLLGSVGSYRFLLAGDVEQEIDPELLSEGLPRLDLLKVAHHGSRTATTQPFVDAVRPRVAIASAGTGNPYGHPTKQTIDRLTDAGAEVYRTDRDGSVRVTFERDGMIIQRDGGRAAARTSPRATSSARTAALGARVGGTPTSTASASSAPASTVPAALVRFRCAIPIAALVPEREATVAPVAIGPPPLREGSADLVGYHRADDGSRAGGGRLPPALPRSTGLVRSTRVRRGGRRGVPRQADRGPGRVGRSAARRGRSAAPRRGQVAAGVGSGEGPRARPWLRGLAGRPRPP